VDRAEEIAVLCQMLQELLALKLLVLFWSVKILIVTVMV